MNVSIQFQALNKKTKHILGKTVSEMWCQICGKIAMLVHKVTLTKNAKN